MPYAVGIDLGTTNSVISVYRRGKVETLSVDGQPTMPSVISFRDGNLLVGKSAKSRLRIDPENSVSSAKRFIGDPSKIYKAGGKSLSSIDVSSFILEQLVKSASEALGQKIRDVVITVPAYFTEAQKEDTKKAGERVGLNVLRIIPEPTAAAIAYGIEKERDQTIMVYDLGGGTFDVSILTIKGNKFEVKAVGGDSQLGGDDFDEAIINWVCKEFQAKTGSDLLRNNTREGRVAKQLLKEAAEAAKIELSQSNNAEIEIPNFFDGHPLEIAISLTQYNQLIEPLLKKTIVCVDSVLRDARLDSSDIDRVILVGGSTRNKAVREIVSKKIKEPYIASKVDEVVSHGAAIVASSLFTPDEDSLPIEVTDVTAHSLGIDVRNSETNELYFAPIIPRQTAYPCKFGYMGLANPRQTEVEIVVYRGESKRPDQNTKLGSLSMPIVPQDDVVPIVAIFELDSNGIIQFTALQLPKDEVIRPILDSQNENSVFNVDDVWSLILALIETGYAQGTTVRVQT